MRPWAKAWRKPRVDAHSRAPSLQPALNPSTSRKTKALFFPYPSSPSKDITMTIDWTNFTPWASLAGGVLLLDCSFTAQLHHGGDAGV